MTNEQYQSLSRRQKKKLHRLIAYNTMSPEEKQEFRRKVKGMGVVGSLAGAGLGLAAGEAALKGVSRSARSVRHPLLRGLAIGGTYAGEMVPMLIGGSIGGGVARSSYGKDRLEDRYDRLTKRAEAQLDGRELAQHIWDELEAIASRRTP